MKLLNVVKLKRIENLKVYTTLNLRNIWSLKNN